jgi:hypothetical protein
MSETRTVDGVGDSRTVDVTDSTGAKAGTVSCRPSSSTSPPTFR